MPRIIPLAPSEAAEARGELIPEGIYYEVRIENVQEVQVKSGDNLGQWMLKLTLRIEDQQPAEGATKAANGRMVFMNIQLWHKARYGLIALNRSLGLDVTDESGGLIAHDAPAYLGKTIAIEINHQEYPTGSGELKANVKRIVVPSTSQPKAAGPQKVSGRVPLARTPKRAPAVPAGLPDDEPATV